MTPSYPRSAHGLIRPHILNDFSGECCIFMTKVAGFAVFDPVFVQIMHDWCLKGSPYARKCSRPSFIADHGIFSPSGRLLPAEWVVDLSVGTAAPAMLQKMGSGGGWGYFR